MCKRDNWRFKEGDRFFHSLTIHYFENNSVKWNEHVLNWSEDKNLQLSELSI